MTYFYEAKIRSLHGRRTRVKRGSPNLRFSGYLEALNTKHFAIGEYLNFKSENKGKEDYKHEKKVTDLDWPSTESTLMQPRV